MKRSEIAHILRAVRAITNEREFVLVGSQAAHLSAEDLPEAMEQSGELDIYPLRRPDLADLIDGAIGEGSMFHATFGYYAQGVGPETAKLPRGWEGRAVRVSPAAMEGAVAIAPELHDLCAAKAVALRPKDWDFIGAAIAARLVRPEILRKRIEMVEAADPAARRAALAWLARLAAAGQAG